MATLASRRSKNDLFNIDFSILPPGKSSAPATPPIPLQSPQLGSIHEPKDAVEPSKSIELRVSEHRLGSGRHAEVYLGSYREKSSAWQACAVKQLGRDRESQQAGLTETVMLSKLAACPQIVDFLGLKEEPEQTAPSSKLAANGHSNRSALAPRYSPGSQSAPSSPLLQSHEKNGSYFEESSSSLRRSNTVKSGKPRSRLSLQATDTAEAPPRLQLLTQYYPLGNLADFVSKHGLENLGQALFFKFASDLLRALVACHAANIIHGDVKPQNCMIDSDFNLVLGDFSSSIFASSNLEDGVGIGSTQYCAPELVKPPPSPFSFPIDIFAAGLTLLHMISGVEPYESLATPSRSVSRTGSLKKRNSLAARRGRASSSAGKMVEMHLHLSKGHAWEWEEKRRLDELEDEDDADVQYILTKEVHEPSRRIRLPYRPFDDLHHLEEFIDVPPWASVQPVRKAALPTKTYSDGHTPVQSFLAGANIVPESVRVLLKDMLSPKAADRPHAAEALERLERSRPELPRYS